MLYNLSIAKDGDLIHVEATGTRTGETVVAMAREMLEACVAQRALGVSVDVRKLTGRLSTLEAYQIPANEFPAMRGAGALKAAAVIDDPAFLDKAQFFEDVARNRGFNLRIFGDVAEASQWLRAEIKRLTG